MGNGTSQSIVLGSPRLPTSYSVHNNYQYQRGVPKYVHPQNRVLPKPVAGQRLRSTDNGSILQTAGTIRGQRQDSYGREENVDSEMMGILRRRSEMIEKENDCYTSNLRTHRMFYSDPDIARRISPDSYRIDEISDSYGNRRSGGGVAVRTSKLKQKKKQKAPEPPPLTSSLPRELDRKPQARNLEERKNQKNLPCRCVNKNKAPQPPAINAHPPPPPPLPSAGTARTKNSDSPTSRSSNGHCEISPPITRVVECHENKPSYEKKVHPLEKWRNCRSTGDVRIDEEAEDPSTSRTTVFNSKMVSENSSKIPSYLPQRPDPFQKEIEAVTKKIAESLQEKSIAVEPSKTTQVIKVSDSTQYRNNSPPKFYFADTEVFKKNNQKNVDSNKNAKETPNSVTKSGNLLKSPNTGVDAKSPRNQNKSSNRTTTDEIVPSLQRFSPSRQRYKSPPGVTTPTPHQNAELGWDELTKNMYNKQDEDSDIDIQLRPVLPRKPLEIPKFSPAEVWQSLGSDGLSSNQSTSDDGPDSIPAYKKNTFGTKGGDNRVRRQSEVPFGLYEKRSNNIIGHKHRSMSDSHWTPRQDLLDDSDVSSIGSEDAVVPRIRTSSVDIPTRFSLPSVMFSNMRPIGSEFKASNAYYSDNVKSKHTKKKSSKPIENNYGMAPNFRKFLSKKNKYASEEDVVVSDSNWTFGQYGLQKRGKQYSSDLMLSEKKRHELMENRNFSDFLGDILVNKANHMRDQMKSSDSGNSNFSFYSTEGQIMYIPEKGGFIQGDDCSPPTKGRVYDIRRRFDPNLESSSSSRPSYQQKNSKKKATSMDLDLGRKRDLELAKMLEDEVRKRRNKEKITIRQQLQKMKNMHTDDDDEDFDDEAYFTEPKSREESQSPFYQPGPSSHFPGSVLGHKPFRFSRLGGAVTTSDSTRLSHWQSSPALLEDSITKNAIRPVPKGHFSSSSVMSSPDPETWSQQPTGIVNSWLQRQRNLESGNKYHLGSTPILEHVPDETNRLTITPNDHANDGDVSSSPTPVPQQKKKERRKTNIYKQLMDIVRKEEKQLKNSQRNDSDPNSRESSFSHCDSSPSTSSEASSTSSAYSYSDSSGSKSHGKNGVAANKEFHSSSYTNLPHNPVSSFQMASVQPYTPNKGYRPVPFQVSSPAVNGYRIPGLQDERKELKATAF